MKIYSKSLLNVALLISFTNCKSSKPNESNVESHHSNLGDSLKNIKSRETPMNHSHLIYGENDIYLSHLSTTYGMGDHIHQMVYRVSIDWDENVPSQYAWHLESEYKKRLEETRNKNNEKDVVTFIPKTRLSEIKEGTKLTGSLFKISYNSDKIKDITYQMSTNEIKINPVVSSLNIDRKTDSGIPEIAYDCKKIHEAFISGSLPEPAKIELKKALTNCGEINDYFTKLVKGGHIIFNPNYKDSEGIKPELPQRVTATVEEIIINRHINDDSDADVDFWVYGRNNEYYATQRIYSVTKTSGKNIDLSKKVNHQAVYELRDFTDQQAISLNPECANLGTNDICVIKYSNPAMSAIWKKNPPVVGDNLPGLNTKVTTRLYYNNDLSKF